VTTPELGRTQPAELLHHVKTLASHLRIDTLKRALDVVQAIITEQSVNLSVLSDHSPGESSVEAEKRRAKRALRDEQRTCKVFLSLMLPLLPPSKLLLSLDRTSWEHGSSPLNLLVLGVVLHGHTLPLVWTALPHDGNFWGRTDALEHACPQQHRCPPGTGPATCWKGLVADREFIVGAWFAFLLQQRIKRAIRIRKAAVMDGLHIDKWFSDLQVGETRLPTAERPDPSLLALGDQPSSSVIT